ncbi:DNA-binding transcriptional LysR family regulator [Stella humosa]|uniref:DNA-binding transcriptional LysR family regulator n=1 Tax=Stella humosa TaxID=94 RepID=A0A3N1MCQ6_9PROT|nr:LysR family transcriptional regulator [Stella humosa]ROQ01493.1 DNA-binding transcriptional LysR family regulator [Stella humosa]BBK31871.1 LysR family transcriptional regulator [Stella humosa]
MMHLELRHYRAFAVLAEALHFGRAAERLNMAQPQLSRLVGFIEREVGVVLLFRTTRAISLTPAGEVFFEQATRLLRQADAVVQVTRRAAAGMVGSITIGYMDFAISGPLPAILRGFREAWPQVDIALEHLWTERQHVALLDRRIDLGFLIGPFEHPDVAVVPVASDRLVVVGPEGHPLAAAAEIDLRTLADAPFIFGAPDKWRPFRNRIDRICLDHGFLPRVVQEPFNSDGIFGLVSAGLGITIYPERPLRIYPRGLVVRPIAGVDARIVTLAAWNRRNASRILENFIAVARSFAVAEDGHGAKGIDI